MTPLHPVVVAAVAAARARGVPALSAGTPDDGRRLIAASRAALGDGPPVGAVDTLEIEGRHGHAIPARLYRPQGDAAGLVVYLHGGGWVLGTLDDYDILARNLVARSGCALLAVDYRLAPEHPFPAGLEDAIDATRWAAQALPRLLGAARPLVLAGDSAGGNLATVSALELRGEVALALQLLIYPVTDSARDTPSYRRHGTGLPLTAADMEWFYTRYAPAASWSDPRISPLRSPDLAGAPPAWIAVAGHDVLADEAQAYARRLADAGVAVALRRYDDLPHGFARMTNLVDSADRAVGEAAAALAAACGRR